MDWQPIATAPKTGEAILLFMQNGVDSCDLLGGRNERIVHVAIGWWSHHAWESDLLEEGSADSFGFSTPMSYSIKPTHWMALPALPDIPGHSSKPCCLGGEAWGHSPDCPGLPPELRAQLFYPGAIFGPPLTQG